MKVQSRNTVPSIRCFVVEAVKRIVLKVLLRIHWKMFPSFCVKADSLSKNVKFISQTGVGVCPSPRLILLLI